MGQANIQYILTGNSHKHDTFKGSEATLDILDKGEMGCGGVVESRSEEECFTGSWGTAERTWQNRWATQKPWDVGYLANRCGVFLTNSRVNILKVTKPRRPP